MSSIERYVDKLDKKGSLVDKASGLVSAGRGSGDGTERIRAEVGSKTHQKININFFQLQDAGMLTPGDAKSRLAEEYRAIKRPLLKNAFGQGILEIPRGNLIMVTSSLPGEGKSFTTINLAISMAMEMDRTVLLVEADVAKPSICQYFGIPNPSLGLVDYLARPELELSDVLLHTNIPKLTLLTAGGRNPTSAELLNSQKMRDLMDELSSRYTDRVVIFDSPPLLLSAEAITLSAFMGQILLVIEAGKTPQAMVKEALALLDSNQTIGVVLNKNRTAAKYSYGYYGGGYGYEAEQGA